MGGRAARESGRSTTRSVRRALAPAIPLVGPAFVASVAYVDPGNVATNVTAGARYGYLLVWVLVTANITAMLVQYLSAKLTIATGATLPELCRARLRRPAALAMWGQAELVAVATDLAELIGGAVALNLLFGVPLVIGGIITGAVSWLILIVQTRHGQRLFERVVIGMLAVVFAGFCYDAIAAEPDPGGLAGGLVPRLAGADSVLLAVGILGATVMPHAIYLHGALVRDRHGGPAPAEHDQQRDREHRRERGREHGQHRREHSRKRALLAATRLDVMTAMTIAGIVNLAMLVAGAAALGAGDADSIAGSHAGFERALGPVTAALFAIALLASGFAATSVGTYAGAVILEGFLGRRVPLAARRAITLVPALAILAWGVEPGLALVLSQVVLSFGIPFALWPLVAFTRQAGLMGAFVNRRVTTVAAVAAALGITTLNLTLIWLTISGP